MLSTLSISLSMHTSVGIATAHPWNPKSCHVHSTAAHLSHTLLAISALHAHAIDAVALLGLVAHLPSLTIHGLVAFKAPVEQDFMILYVGKKSTVFD